MFDAVTVYAKALRGIGGTKAIKAEPNSCANRTSTGWSHGFSLINFMRVVSTSIKFWSKKNAHNVLCPISAGQMEHVKYKFVVR